MQNPIFSVTKAKVSGSDLKANSVIMQLRQYRLLMKLQQVYIQKNNPTVFRNGSHISALEHGRQRETSTQIKAYAQSLGIKEITIIF